MTIKWNRDGDDLEVNGLHFNVTCKVRNEIDLIYVRRLHDPVEVCYAIEKGKFTEPYMPRKFPKGTWVILGIEKSDERDFAPVKIITNAHQLVETWTLDKKKGYDKPTGKFVDDSGYLLHWSQFSITTRGCGRVGNNTPTQVNKLAEIIQEALNKKDKVILEVV